MNTPVLFVVCILDTIALLTIAMIVVFAPPSAQPLSLAVQIFTFAGATTTGLLAFGQSLENKKQVKTVDEKVDHVKDRVEDVKVAAKAVATAARDTAISVQEQIDRVAVDVDGKLQKYLEKSVEAGELRGQIEGERLQRERRKESDELLVEHPAVEALPLSEKTEQAAEKLGDKIGEAIDKKVSHVGKDVKVVKQDVKDVKDKILDDPEEKE
jgi:hypothetical protein